MFRYEIPFVNAAPIDEAETKKQKKQKEGGKNKGAGKWLACRSRLHKALVAHPLKLSQNCI